MGWAYGKSWDGREIGYGVEAVCEQEGCTEEIDRGLAYLCGDLDQVLHDSGVGCGHYFCSSHVFIGFRYDGRFVQLCEPCEERYQIDDDGNIRVDDEEAEAVGN